MSTKPFEIHDLESPAWRKVEARLQKLLAEDRKQLEGPGLDEKPTSMVRLRARINLLKELLEIPDQVRKDHAEAVRRERGLT